MPETPFPHIEDLDPHLLAGAPDSRVRRRPSMPGRPVSAFAPAHRPDAAPVALDDVPVLTDEETEYASSLRLAGIVSELHGAEVARVARHVISDERRARHLDILFAYYAAGGDPIVSRRRMVTDRWFIYSTKQSLTLGQVLGRLLGVLPEISAARLERVGGPEGTLVVRCGDHVCALEDELEEGPDERTVSISGLVRALNVLLDRQGVRARLVGLFGDGTREAYVGISSLASAVPLAQSDYLSATDAEGLMEQTGW